MLYPWLRGRCKLRQFWQKSKVIKLKHIHNDVYTGLSIILPKVLTLILGELSIKNCINLVDFQVAIGTSIIVDHGMTITICHLKLAIGSRATGSRRGCGTSADHR